MVIIGILGSACAGKKSVAEMLQTHGFEIIQMRDTDCKVVLGKVRTAPTQNYVIFPIDSKVHNLLRKLTFYKLLWVDASTSIRFARFQAREASTLSIEEFVRKDDQMSFGRDEAAYLLRKEATRIVNNGDKAALAIRVRTIPHECGAMRKGWDSFFMGFARLAARHSNCMKTPVGAVVVNSDNRIVSCGYNGTPIGWPNCISGGCQRCNDNSGQGKHLDKCYCVHAEVNSILYGGRDVCKGGTLYATLMPCLNCAKTIVQVGITRIVFQDDYSDQESVLLLQSKGMRSDKMVPEDNPYLI